MFKISKENKKLIFGIILAAVVFLSYQVIASYMTNPVDTSLKYPNPGHYPGEIGPGTFNASNSTNPYWSFPDSSGDRFTGLEIRNGSGQFYKTLQVFNNFYTYANTYLGNDSSDKTTVKGNLEVSGNISANNYPPQACGSGYSIRKINSDGSVVCELDDVGITSESDPLSVHKSGDTMTGDLNVTGGIVVGNPAEGNKGPGTINAEKIYVNGSEVGGGGRKIDVWVGSDSASNSSTPCSVTCKVSVPDGYTVIYAHKKGLSGKEPLYAYYSYGATYCAYPSFVYLGLERAGKIACESTNLGDTGPLNITVSNSCYHGGAYGCGCSCGIYAIAIKIE